MKPNIKMAVIVGLGVMSLAVANVSAASPIVYKGKWTVDGDKYPFEIRIENDSVVYVDIIRNKRKAWPAESIERTDKGDLKAVISNYKYEGYPYGTVSFIIESPQPDGSCDKVVWYGAGAFQGDTVYEAECEP